MTDRTTDEIEREIEAERGALARSLDELQGHFSPEAIIDTASGYLRDHGGEVAENLMRQAKQNPMAVALAGAGIAWLIAGPVKARDTSEDMASRHRPLAPKPAFDPVGQETVSGFRHAEPRMASFDDRIAALEPEEDDTNLWQNVKNQARDTGAQLKGAWTDMTHTSSHSESLRDRLAHGTEHLSDIARDRVIAARAAAYDAQQKMSERAGDYAAAGRDAFISQPLVGGLLALGVGAMIGAMLPRTRKEDAYLGAHRDRAVAEAERIFQEESAKLRAVAEAAAGEAKAVAAETLRSVKEGTPSADEAMQRTEASLKSATDRVKDAAKAEADRQKVGSSFN
ncbi:DUF3618 domain-containing protein [Jannaschia pohangensis]|uniref:Membrane-anchored ribosome-binding protein, inhibits growth in stationary phase, ElaB/YqjD/DUF883 family n=1 Tax=Jannaschia pohangensis TaxID=390807 RepID=A0A1I3THG2_9RHOB|nr:DUF3618 domain-containing protein [Jannaschia pohangensis]SFJ70060.1 Protein of unknown function [Jannaschia pohangensis]